MKEGGYNKAPKTFDSIDSVPEPEKKDGPLVLESIGDTGPDPKIEAYANGNPVRAESAHETLGDRFERTSGVAFEKVGNWGKRTADSFGTAIEKGGKALASLQGNVQEFVRHLNSEQEGVGKLWLNMPEGIRESGKAVEADAAEATAETAAAKEQVETLAADYSPEKVPAVREALRAAAEKNLRAGSENFDHARAATGGILNWFKTNLLNLKVEKVTSNPDWVTLFTQFMQKRAERVQTGVELTPQTVEIIITHRIILWNELAALQAMPTQSAAEQTPVAEAPAVETPVAEPAIPVQAEAPAEQPAAQATEAEPVKMPEMHFGPEAVSAAGEIAAANDNYETPAANGQAEAA